MMEGRRILALLGRPDEPTDAVEEYCRYLGGALRAYGIEMDFARVKWAERGWSAALRELRQNADAWCVRVLRDAHYRALLAERRRHAHKQYFSWEAIAARYVEALGK
jgi:hypothetical protein